MVANSSHNVFLREGHATWLHLPPRRLVWRQGLCTALNIELPARQKWHSAPCKQPLQRDHPTEARVQQQWLNLGQDHYEWSPPWLSQNRRQPAFAYHDGKLGWQKPEYAPLLGQWLEKQDHRALQLDLSGNQRRCVHQAIPFLPQLRRKESARYRYRKKWCDAIWEATLVSHSGLRQLWERSLDRQGLD